LFNSISHLIETQAHAVDGDLGPIRDALFDDHRWAIRYLVVNARAWLAEREVLISPYSIKQPVGHDRRVEVALTRRLVAASPDMDTELPITRKQERELMRHYHYPEYWHGDGLWALRAMPAPKLSPLPFSAPRVPHAAAAGEGEGGLVDLPLRSAEGILDFEVRAADNTLGRVQDVVFDDESWLIRYLVVDTHGWWPRGRKVLVGLHWVDRVDWTLQHMHVTLTRDQVRASPAYQDVASIHRDYEVQLHANYLRPGYWH